MAAGSRGHGRPRGQPTTWLRRPRRQQRSWPRLPAPVNCGHRGHAAIVATGDGQGSQKVRVAGITAAAMRPGVGQCSSGQQPTSRTPQGAGDRLSQRAPMSSATSTPLATRDMTWVCLGRRRVGGVASDQARRVREGWSGEAEPRERTARGRWR